jgi:tetratricopeptide (TPR) repeat protein/predicted Ser/Thr protein kinase
MSLDINVCAFCGQRLDSTLVREQYGGACPRCMGAFAPEGSPAATSNLPPPTGGEFGKYVLTDRLGKGGMGEVWKAVDTELKRTVALKFLQTEDTMEVARFKREAHLAASLSHAHIGAIFEVGQIDGRHFLAMQYVPGRTLEKFPKEDRRLLVRLIRDAARAVDHAHRNGVIHRDIKPANLMVEEVHDECRVVVLDFGIARAIEGGEKLSMTGDIVGTPAYMSPEQAKGQELDERADVYSLGATLYEILTGRAPFEGANMYDLLKKVEEEEPIAPRRLNPTIAHDLETIVLKCLEKAPVRRYDSGKELADDLDRFLNGEAVQAKRANTIYRLRIKLAKSKAIVTTAGIAAVVLLSVLGWWIFVGRPHSEYLGHMSDGRKLWEEARVAAITGVSPSEIRKKSGTARACFEAALRARSFADAHLMKGRCLALEGDEKGAQAAYELAIELDAGSADARVELAKSLLLKYVASRGAPLMGSYSGSPKPYFGALASESPEERQLRERAEGLLNQGETAPTQQKLLQGLMAMGKPAYDIAAQNLADYTKEERWDAQALMLEAMCRYYLRQFDEAIPALDRSLNLVPRSEGFRWRGLIKEAKGQYPEAIADYTKAIESDPEHSRAYANRGIARQAKGLMEEAFADYTKAIELDPKSALAHTARGAWKRAKGLLDEAIAGYDKAIECDQAYAPAYFNRANAKQAKGQHEEAISDFSKAIDLGLRTAGAYLNRGNSKQAKGQMEGAIEDYTTATELDPKYARAFANRGYANLAKGLQDEAVADWLKALELAPPDWPLRADLQARIGAAEVTRLYQEASSLHQLKRYREAIESFKKLIEAHPKAGPVVLSSAYNTACCHALLGETDNALEWLEKAVKLGYSDADHIDKDSDLDSLRNEPRFRAIVEQLKSRQQ